MSLGSADVNLFHNQFLFERLGIVLLGQTLRSIPSPSKRWLMGNTRFCPQQMGCAITSALLCSSPQASSAHTRVPLASCSSLSKQPHYNCVAQLCPIPLSPTVEPQWLRQTWPWIWSQRPPQSPAVDPQNVGKWDWKLKQENKNLHLKTNMLLLGLCWYFLQKNNN